MRLPGEDRDDLNTTERAWELLEPWGRTPDNTRLERHAVYSFAARWADRWNVGRLAIAGDAAHLMPPFAGQGMCSGIRDAANLSWKIDRVLRGQSDVALLDSYTSERSIHLQHAITMSVELGKVICVLDEREAAERDERMITAGADPRRVLPVTALPVLGTGVTADTIDLAPLRGTLLPQFPLQHEGRLELLDDATGPGAVLLLRDSNRIVPEETVRLLEHAGVQVMSVESENRSWPEWFDQNNAACILVRPDRYIFGALPSCADIHELACQYAERIHAVGSADPKAAVTHSLSVSG
jgi:hypothetical protein